MSLLHYGCSQICTFLRAFQFEEGCFGAALSDIGIDLDVDATNVGCVAVMAIFSLRPDGAEPRIAIISQLSFKTNLPISQTFSRLD
jgi:hypothetical protein